MKKIDFKPKRFNNSWKSVLILILLMFCIGSYGRLCRLLEIRTAEANQAGEIKAQLLKVEKEKKELEAKLVIDPTPSQSDIEKYIKVIFGKNAKVAIAVSHHECSPKNKQYPKCVAVSDKEYSVGIFQINLKNKTQKVHFDKIPAKTFEAKVEWLKNPMNNVLIAKAIFADSGFSPWSAYTNLSYLKSMN